MSIYPAYRPDNNFNDESRDFIVRINGEEAYVHRVFVDMHSVQGASLVAFDLTEPTEVEIECLNSFAWRYKIRPESLNIKYEYENRKIKFTLTKPCNLSIEVNDDIFHNLHLFASEPILRPDGRLISPGIHGDEIISCNETAILLPGVHFISSCILNMKDNSSLYISGGAVLVGSINCLNAKNVKIYGNGMINLHQYPHFSCFNAVTLSSSQNVVLEGITIVNPPHYSIYIGSCQNVFIKNIKSFSCEGWSDGIDIMASQNITIDGVFMRNSDDCIAIYASRWDFHGSTKSVRVTNSTLWADVAHPTTIGCHGNMEKGGDTIEDITFENIDVLNHHEPQDDYTGVFAINVGDGNEAFDITYKNIRVEQYQRGRLIDLRVCFNKTYNALAGKSIHDVTFENISYLGYGALPSRIEGYSNSNNVYNIRLKNVTESGKSISENLIIGPFTDNITIE